MAMLLIIVNRGAAFHWLRAFFLSWNCLYSSVKETSISISISTTRMNIAHGGRKEQRKKTKEEREKVKSLEGQ